ncbi:MAG: hypothetical protein H0T76_24850 [Nannocystis sp.]|nr:hypothetical protein [Nannocystis sp.]MBA3549721.1 hypothetical protein [Nannocystis sp.]
MPDPQPTFLRQTEASALIAAIADPITRDLVRALLTRLWWQRQAGPPPVADFDLEFFVRAAIAFGEQHALIGSILQGDHQDPWE